MPYKGHADLLVSLATELAGKIVVDCVNPLGFDKHGPFPLPVAAGSAAQEAQQLLPDSTVIAAFHHVSAVLLDDPAVDHFDDDVLVLGEDREAVAVVWTWLRRSRARVASTPAGSATPARSRPSPPTSSRSTGATRPTPASRSQAVP